MEKILAILLRLFRKGKLTDPLGARGPAGTIVMVVPEDGTGYLSDTFDLIVLPGLHKLYPQTNGPSVYEGAPYPMTMPGMPMPVMGEIYADVPLKAAAFW